MARPTQAVIDVAALRHNIAQVRACAPTQRIMAIIKADAYGHGAVRVANAIAHAVDAFGVTCLEEAIELRRNDIIHPIVLLEGFYSIDELSLIAQYGLESVIHHSHQVNQLLSLTTPLSTPIPIWLKVNTGMHRLGLEPQAVEEIWHRLTARPDIAFPIRLMSHLACADELQSPYTIDQYQTFSAIVNRYQVPASLANSAGILAWQYTHFNWVRPGIMLYGVSPFANTTGQEYHLRPVMRLESQLISITICHAGKSVGYGATWHCPETMPVGIVGIGYGDGYPRHAPIGTPVLVNTQRVPLIGRVSMDMIAVDLRTQPSARIGDSVILWGDGLPIEEVATLSGTISYELTCNINKRVRHIDINA